MSVKCSAGRFFVTETCDEVMTLLATSSDEIKVQADDSVSCLFLKKKNVIDAKVIRVAEVNAASAGQITETSCIRPDVCPALMIEENLKVEVLSLFRKPKIVPLDLHLKPNEQLNTMKLKKRSEPRGLQSALCHVLISKISILPA